MTPRTQEIQVRYVVLVLGQDLRLLRICVASAPDCEERLELSDTLSLTIGSSVDDAHHALYAVLEREDQPEPLGYWEFLEFMAPSDLATEVHSLSRMALATARRA